MVENIRVKILEVVSYMERLGEPRTFRRATNQSYRALSGRDAATAGIYHLRFCFLRYSVTIQSQNVRTLHIILRQAIVAFNIHVFASQSQYIPKNKAHK